MGVLAREVEALRGTLRGWAEEARGRWAARPGPARSAAIAFAACALVAGFSALFAQLRLPGRLPSAQDWAALRALVEREARPGDAAALAPPWAERAREILPASVPVLAERRYEGEDLLGVRRVWIVSVPRAPGASHEVAEDLAQRGAAASRPIGLGALEVSRLDVSFPTLPFAFLPDRLAGTEGSVSGTVREVREVGGAPRPCLVARLSAGTTLTLLSGPVRVGRLVRGHVGVPGGSALPGPVRVSVRVDGEDAGAAEVSGSGFVPFQIDTTRFGLRTGRITLGITSRVDLDLCLDAVTLP